MYTYNLQVASNMNLLYHNAESVTGYGFVQDIKGAFKQVQLYSLYLLIYLNFTNFRLGHIFQAYMACHSTIVGS